MNNLMNDGQPVGISQSPPVTPLDQLLGALARQTQAMLELAESNRLLAESNREMVDYLADQQGEDAGDEAPRRDLAGRPI